MRIYFSSDPYASESACPERILLDKKPSVMLTFFEIRCEKTMQCARFLRHVGKRRKENACAEQGEESDDRDKR
jgi:hypothetical protein